MNIQDIKPGDIIRQKGYILLPKNGGSISHCETDLSAHGYHTLGKYEIIFVVPPDFVLDGDEIGNLDLAMRELRQDFNKQMAVLKGRKNTLEQVKLADEAANVPNP